MEPVPDTALASIETLAARVTSIPELLGAAGPAPRLEPFERRAGHRFVTTGIGAAEGPARFCAATLRALGRVASFVPLASFLEGPIDGGGSLIVFSQGLSPNARIALARAGDFERTHLLTGVIADDAAPPGSPARIVASLAARGVAVFRHEPHQEDGLLVRVVGPALSSLAAIELAGRIADVADRAAMGARRSVLATAVRRATGAIDPAVAPLLLGRRLVLVASGSYVDHVHGLAWKLLEGLGAPLPPVLDVLSFAHGPLQELHEREATVIALERGRAPRDAELFDRLGETLVPERHAFLRLVAAGEPSLALFEHDAMLNALLVAALRLAPRDLGAWCGSPLDRALYAVGHDALATKR